MIDDAVLRARGDELCRCTHARAWHDACSKCDCPWFLAPDNKGAVRRWNADRRTRRLAEADGAEPKAAEPQAEGAG